jgi:hypothetical protein
LLAGDQGEGHPPSFFIFFPKHHGWTRPNLLQRRPTPTSDPLLVLSSSPVSFPHPVPSPFRPFATS